MGKPARKGNGAGHAAEPFAAGGVGASESGSGTRDDVQALGPDNSGRWLVTTSGSHHVFDLDARTYRRQPRPGHGRFPFDGQVVALTRVERWPRLGSTFFIWVDDAQLPELVEHWHQCSTILSITRLPDDTPAPEGADT